MEDAIREFIETKAVAIFRQSADHFKNAHNSTITTRVLSHIEMTDANEAKILQILQEMHATPSTLKLCAIIEAESNSVQKVKQLLCKRLKAELQSLV